MLSNHRLYKQCREQIAHLLEQRRNTKRCDFSGETSKSFEVLYFSVRRTTTQVLSSASYANCVMALYLLEVHLKTLPSIQITQKCQILSCETFVKNERNACDDFCVWRKEI